MSESRKGRRICFDVMHMEKINTYAEYVSALARFDELFFSTDDNTPKADPSLGELERLSVLLEQYEKETTQIQDNVYLENSVNLHDMEKSLQIRNSTVEFLTFVLDGKEDGVQVMYTDETIWLTQDAIAVLFDKGRTTIVEHLKNIFNEGELDRDSVCRKFRHTASDGKNYSVNYYNLDAVISVGYRANSVRATEFRRWCTNVLRQFAIRGYVIDKKRMENGSFIGQDYFEHLLAEIREIRLSERRFYQKLTDIYSTAIDYSSDAATTKLFFKKIQNKIHYAVHGHTAAELIVERASAEKEHMGLTTWENAPDGKIVKPDVSVAKNYLNELELEDMGRLVNAVLDMAERMAKRHIPMTMEDWSKRMDIILEAGGDAILDDAGQISAEYAKNFAESEFEKYRIIQDRLFESDFDRFNQNLLEFPDEID